MTIIREWVFDTPTPEENRRECAQLTGQLLIMGLENPHFMRYARGNHAILAHKLEEHGCAEHITQLVASFMHVFHVGWLVGRQELINEQVAGQK